MYSYLATACRQLQKYESSKKQKKVFDPGQPKLLVARDKQEGVQEVDSAWRCVTESCHLTK